MAGRGAVPFSLLTFCVGKDDNRVALNWEARQSEGRQCVAGEFDEFERVEQIGVEGDSALLPGSQVEGGEAFPSFLQCLENFTPSSRQPI